MGSSWVSRPRAVDNVLGGAGIPPESVLTLRLVMLAALFLGGLALIRLYRGVMSRNKHHNF